MDWIHFPEFAHVCVLYIHARLDVFITSFLRFSRCCNLNSRNGESFHGKATLFVHLNQIPCFVPVDLYLMAAHSWSPDMILSVDPISYVWIVCQRPLPRQPVPKRFQYRSSTRLQRSLCHTSWGTAKGEISSHSGYLKKLVSETGAVEMPVVPEFIAFSMLFRARSNRHRSVN